MNAVCNYAVCIQSEWSDYEMHVTRSAILSISGVCMYVCVHIYIYIYIYSELNGDILKLQQKQKINKFSVMAFTAWCYLL